jgi:pimeloyl-CoA synthetase
LDKEGKLIQVIFLWNKSKNTLERKSIEKAKALQEAGINATSGVGEDVTNQAFDYTEKGVAITGGAAKYAVKMSLGS